MKTISLSELEEWQNDERCFALVDVLPDYAGRERRRTENRAQEFVEKIVGLGVKKGQRIVLYEASTASIEAAVASDALSREGFNEVYCFLGPRAAMYAAQHEKE